MPRRIVHRGTIGGRSWCLPATISCSATTATTPSTAATGVSSRFRTCWEVRSSCTTAMRRTARRRSTGSLAYAGAGSASAYTDVRPALRRNRTHRTFLPRSCRAEVSQVAGAGTHMAGLPHNRHRYEEGSLDQYLRDISIYPLITREQEVELAKLIRDSDQEALDTLVRSNLRFVVSVAKKYQNQGVSLSDLINEGNLGLIRAAHKFDETKGIKFISYAVWWIRQAILQALAEQSRIVRVPLNRAGTLHRIGKRASALLQELGREATHAEIANGTDLTEEEVAKTMASSQIHLSLDAPMTPGEDNWLLDYLPDTTNQTPDEETFDKALTESIQLALAGLKEREAKILRLYFGLDGAEPMTLEQIGAALNITRERVRQIKEKALARLQHVSRARALESYLG